LELEVVAEALLLNLDFREMLEASEDFLVLAVVLVVMELGGLLYLLLKWVEMVEKEVKDVYYGDQFFNIKIDINGKFTTDNTRFF
jgi:hypothetical protein